VIQTLSGSKLEQLSALLLLTCFCLRASAQGTAFTYQGQLNDGVSPASGIYDLRFAIYDSLSGGTQQGSLLTNSAVPVSNGLFTVTLDFGNQFPGAARWLEISVRTNNAVNFFTLSPRQPLTPAPYAITAGNVVGGGLAAGIYSNAVTFNNSGNSFNGTFSGNGSGLSNVNAGTLGGLGSSNFWTTAGNAGTTGTANFLGTSDNQALEIRVNGVRALRLEPKASGQPNLIGGSPNNFVAPGTLGSVIGGGGTTNGGAFTNSISSQFGAIGGGAGNTIQFAADYSFLGGGRLNTIQTNSTGSTIAGGQSNSIGTNSPYSAIGGGVANHIQDVAAHSTIAGGNNNSIQGAQADATIGGGFQNLIQSGSDESTIGGGDFNMIQTNNYGSTIAGGYNNVIQTGGGEATIGGGYFNTIQTNAQFTTIAGGRNNTNSGIYATVPGGDQNVAADHSFAAGHRAKANHSGSFVWADATDADFGTTATNQFLVRASGGIGINTNNTAGAALNINGTVLATAFSGNGAGLSNVTASSLATSNFWAIGGNTVAGGQFLGSTNNQPIEIKVNGARALRLEPTLNDSVHSNIVNVIGGSAVNVVAAGVYGATIAGGGAANYGVSGLSNSVAADFGSIGGGYANQIQDAVEAVIGGGNHNTVQSGGFDSVIGGGNGNMIQTNASLSTISGGQENTNIGFFATVPGGNQNVAADNSFAAGHRAKATHTGSFVWADSTDTDFPDATNNQFLIRATGGVGIGTTNSVFPLTVGAPDTPLTTTAQIGAFNNGNAFVVTRQTGANVELQLGVDNLEGVVSVVSDHPLVFRAGNGAGTGNHEYMRINTNGFVGIGTTTPTNKLDVIGNISCSSNVFAHGVLLTSDRNSKENFATLEPESILEKVAALPLTKWNYKGEEEGTKHIGPMAQDFHAAFGLNGEDDKHISVVDESGVALAAIQALNLKLEEHTGILESQLERSAAENADLKRRLEKLEQLIQQGNPESK
jgi:hypothetical protein